ncbi:MAG: PHP domain-containing protein [Bacillota bacterium]|nr:PHP domain-containing protein [Bacillota bacterium]
MHNTNKTIDLHMHSNYSDGLFTPTELITIVAKSGIKAVALTDHDSIEGLKEAAEAVSAAKIEFVPGVEISVIENDTEIHLLGYYPEKLKILNDALVLLREERLRRMDIIIERLQKMKFNLSKGDIEREAGAAAPGRLHLARVMLNKRYVQNLEEAFSLYLGWNRPAYYERKTLSTAETMSLLKESGAVKVIAHPGEKCIDRIKYLIKLGLDGIEVYHPDHGRSMIQYYSKVAAANNLIITGGSDFHGESRDKPAYPKHFAIDYEFYRKLKEAAGK